METICTYGNWLRLTHCEEFPLFETMWFHLFRYNYSFGRLNLQIRIPTNHLETTAIIHYIDINL